MASLTNGLSEIVALLEDIDSSPPSKFNKDTRAGASKALSYILTFEFLSYLHFWNPVLMKIDVVQKKLQGVLDLVQASDHLNALAASLEAGRESIATNALNQATELCSLWGIEVNRTRVRRRKRMYPDECADEAMPIQAELKRRFLEATDTLVQQVRNRHSRLTELASKLGPLCRPTILLNMTAVEQARVAYQFAEYYPCDVSGKELAQEINDISGIVTRLHDPPVTPLAWLKYLSDSSDDLCPNLKTAIQVLLSIECSVAGCERCHSKLRLIKTYLRSTMTQRRFQDLALLSIEKERTRDLDFSDLVEQFVRKKMRKMFL